MGKVVLFAILTMDGCLLESSKEAYKRLNEMRNELYGIDKMKGIAQILDANTPLTLLSDWVKESRPCSTYLIEASIATASIINGMFRMRQIDEIILWILPVIGGSWDHLFQASLPESVWTCKEVKSYKDGSIRIIYCKQRS